MSNYPPGTANDPNAPWNEPLIKRKKVLVEVNAELGTIVEVEVECDDTGYPYTDHMKEVVENELRNKYSIDNKDTILNDVLIWGWDFK